LSGRKGGSFGAAAGKRVKDGRFAAVGKTNNCYLHRIICNCSPQLKEKLAGYIAEYGSDGKHNNSQDHLPIHGSSLPPAAQRVRQAGRCHNRFIWIVLTSIAYGRTLSHLLLPIS
jgi:hypothetical protein